MRARPALGRRRGAAVAGAGIRGRGLGGRLRGRVIGREGRERAPTGCREHRVERRAGVVRRRDVAHAAHFVVAQQAAVCEEGEQVPVAEVASERRAGLARLVWLQVCRAEARHVAQDGVEGLVVHAHAVLDREGVRHEARRRRRREAVRRGHNEVLDWERGTRTFLHVDAVLVFVPVKDVRHVARRCAGLDADHGRRHARLDHVRGDHAHRLRAYLVHGDVDLALGVPAEHTRDEAAVKGAAPAVARCAAVRTL